MPYTNPWSDIIPDGAANANTVDDAIRQLRLDVHERMNAVVADWTTDPVVPIGGSGSGTGVKVGKVLFLPFAQWSMLNNAYSDPAAGNERFLYVAAGVEAWCPVNLPPDVTIRQIDLMFYRDTLNTTTLSLRRRMFTTAIVAVDTQVAIAVSPAAFYMQILTISGMSEVVTDQSYYYLIAKGAGGLGPKIYAAKITYDCPDSTATL
ncbi:MAG: hypothetical protein H0U60_09835 [Blastocatellia bacterium]|nr:hypothetical protein [Blastocatellia bacterium]